MHPGSTKHDKYKKIYIEAYHIQTEENKNQTASYYFIKAYSGLK